MPCGRRLGKRRALPHGRLQTFRFIFRRFVLSDRRHPSNPPRRAAHGGDELAPTGSRRAAGRLCPYRAALRRGRVGRPWPGRLCPSRAGLWPAARPSGVAAPADCGLAAPPFGVAVTAASGLDGLAEGMAAPAVEGMATPAAEG
ncbi:uncharacterized protein [Miscanthus floridulus]|uniref:uncharacterized protein n=1 Tax=Miscanthus floridulus TaxID=154761 RepID=UPI003459EE7C